MNTPLKLSKSYGWAYGDTPTIVITNKNLQIDRNNIEIYSGELNKLDGTLCTEFNIKYNKTHEQNQ